MDNGQADGWTEGVKPIYPPTTLLCRRYNDADYLSFIGPWNSNVLMPYHIAKFYSFIKTLKLLKHMPKSRIKKALWNFWRNWNYIITDFHQWQWNRTQNWIRKKPNNIIFHKTVWKLIQPVSTISFNRDISLSIFFLQKSLFLYHIDCIQQV